MLYQIICIALYNADHTNLFQNPSTRLTRRVSDLPFPPHPSALHSSLKFDECLGT